MFPRPETAGWITELLIHEGLGPRGQASRRVQGWHSHLLPRERPRVRRGIMNCSWEATMEPNTVPNHTTQPLADDILRGADEIAQFIFGEGASRRKVYYLAECTRIPIFRLGSVLCARWSGLMNWIASQESRGQ